MEPSEHSEPLVFWRIATFKFTVHAFDIIASQFLLNPSLRCFLHVPVIAPDPFVELALLNSSDLIVEVALLNGSCPPFKLFMQP